MRKEQTPSVLRESAGPDLRTQLESLLDTVWWCERLWKLENRIESARAADHREGAQSNAQ